MRDKGVEDDEGQRDRCNARYGAPALGLPEDRQPDDDEDSRHSRCGHRPTGLRD